MAANIDPSLIKMIIGYMEKGFSSYTISKELSVSYDKVARVAMMYVQAGGEYRGVKVKGKHGTPEHGTTARYGGKHKCRCPLCVHANTQRAKESKAKRDLKLAMGLVDVPHGTKSGYFNWGCRCGVCGPVGREANRKALETPVETQWNKGQRWVPDEQKKTHTYDTTARELAMTIGRTTSAVHSQRGKMWKHIELKPTN